MVEYRRAEAEHADELLAKMRDADRAECEATGYTPKAALLHSMGASKERYAVYFNGEFAGIYGVVESKASSTLEPLHFAWFLSTPVVEKYPKTFFKESLRVTHELSKKYGTLINYVDARYERALEWLYRIGFALEYNKQVKGPTGQAFIPVRRVRWQEV